MNVAVLASHEGTTLQHLIDARVSGQLPLSISLVISNSSSSGALTRARRAGIPAVHLSSTTHADPARLDEAMLEALVHADVDLVLLAGYMKKVGREVLGL